MSNRELTRQAVLLAAADQLVRDAEALGRVERTLSESERGLTLAEVVHRRAKELQRADRTLSFHEALDAVFDNDPRLASAFESERGAYSPARGRALRVLNERAARGDGFETPLALRDVRPAPAGEPSRPPASRAAAAASPGTGAVAEFMEKVDEVRQRDNGRTSVTEAAAIVATSHPALKAMYDRELAGQVAGLERGGPPLGEDA
ncbi:MAG TPA: hypothetical protein VLT84_11830 [Acidobacteriota bacterium]|nr:hypothetical protein [Acidobacteriota bacterium]